MLLAGRFEVDEEEVARGGMAVILRGVDVQRGGDVALKLSDVTSERLAERFSREWALLADIRHPNIVQYVDHGRLADGRLYLAMEWLEGEDLETRLKRGRLANQEALTLVKRMASALAEVHARGVIHRDVKPANIFLAGGRPHAAKLLDFGIAQVADQRLTRTGAIVGTPGYLAPEQARGEPVPATDVFALGVVFHECLTGMSAYVGEHPRELVELAISNPLPPLSQERPDLPKVWSTVVERMTAMKVDERITDARKLVELLNWLEESETGERGAHIGDSERTLEHIILISGAEEVPLRKRVKTRIRAEEGKLDSIAPGVFRVQLGAQRGVEHRAIAAAGLAVAIQAARPFDGVALVSDFVLPGEAARDALSQRAATLLDGHARRVPKVGDTLTEPPRVRVDPLTADLLGGRFEPRLLDDGALELFGGNTSELLPDRPLRGRNEVLEQLDQIWNEARAEGHAAVVSLIGIAGMGKSSVLQSWLTRAGDDTRVIAVRGGTSSLGPLDTLRRAIARHYGLGQASPSARRARITERASQHFRGANELRVATFVGELVGGWTVEPEERLPHLLRAARAERRIMADQLRRAALELLVAELAAGPTILAVDDAHLADLPSLAVLGTAARMSQAPLLLLLTGRPELATTLESAGVDGATTVLLEPLSQADAEALARDELRDAADPELVSQVVLRAEGNPHFLVALATSMAQRPGALPASLLAATQARLAQLVPDVRRTLRAVAVLAGEASKEAVAALLDVGVGIVEGWLQRLQRAGLLMEEGGRYGFTSIVHAEAAYATLTDEDRRHAHQRAAEWLRDHDDAPALVLATHWEKAGQPQKSIRWLLEAARGALVGTDYDGVFERVAHAERLGVVGETRAQFRLLQAEALQWLGRSSESLAVSLEGVGDAAVHSEAWMRLLASAIRAAYLSGEPKVLRDLARRLLAFEPSPELSIPFTIPLAMTTSALLDQGEYELAMSAEKSLEATLLRIRSLEPYLLGWAAAARAAAAHHRGELVAFREHLIDAADAFTACGDRNRELVQRHNLGVANLQVGRLQEAEFQLRRATVLAADLGIERISASALSNLGGALIIGGKLEEAASVLAEAERRLDQVESQSSQVGVRLYAAELALLQGDAETAGRKADEALARDPRAMHAPMAHALRALAWLELGDLDAAEQEARTAFTGLDEAEGARPELVRLSLIRVLRAKGADAEAASLQADALGHLQAKLSTLPDQRARQAFLRLWDRRSLMPG